MSILNQPEISKAYFFPQDIRCDGAIEVDVGDAVLRCYHHIENQDGRTLIHFHGNGESVGHYVEDDFPELFSRHMNGINVLMVEYRGYGGSTGEVEMASMLPDGKRVMEQLKIDPAKTIAYGRSIGSLYALELVARLPNLAGLVLDSGIADIKERFLARKEIADWISDWDEVDSEIELHFNHRAKIEGYEGKVLLLHAVRDRLIHLTHADRLYKWAAKAEVRKYTAYMQGDHNSIFPVNQFSMLLHLEYLERELFANAEFDARKLLDVPVSDHAIDRGEMLDKEKLEAEPKENSKPHLFTKIRNFFTEKSKRS